MGRNREPSVKALRPEFWRHWVLSEGTQRRSLPRHQSEEIKILNISFLRVRIEPTPPHHNLSLNMYKLKKSTSSMLCKSQLSLAQPMACLWWIDLDRSLLKIDVRVSYATRITQAILAHCKSVTIHTYLWYSDEIFFIYTYTYICVYCYK